MPTTTTGRVRYGVSGWDYRDWQGPLYPRPAPKGFRALPILARFLDFIEVNVTFYRPLGAPVSTRWLAETPSHFAFVIKAFRGWTHEAAPLDGPELGTFREHIAPILEAGRLHGVLAQYPPSFRDTLEHRHRILGLRDALAPAPLFVEVRHREFYQRDFFEFLQSQSLRFVNVDLPSVRSLPRPSRVNTGPTAFLRLHGRNVTGWQNPRANRDQRYDYEYRSEELAELRESVVALLERVPEVLVAANNHFGAHAPAAIVELKSRVEQRKVPAPSALIGSHPRLRKYAEPLEGEHAP